MSWDDFLIIFAGFVLLLDRNIEPYPPRLTTSKKPGREIIVICSLWVVALIANALRQVVLVPTLSSTVSLQSVCELIYLPILSLLFLILPLLLSMKIDHLFSPKNLIPYLELWTDQQCMK